MRKRLAIDARWQRRSRIIERPFAQIKQHDGFRRWTVWGLENVQVQWSLLCTTLNLRVLYRRWKADRSVAKAMKVVLATIQSSLFQPLPLKTRLFLTLTRCPA
jgi:hypothetical protein